MQGFFDLAANLWAGYGSTLLTCMMWGAIGYMLTLPVMFVQVVYNTVKVGNAYDLYGDYRKERLRFKREIKLYGAANTSVVLLLAILVIK